MDWKYGLAHLKYNDFLLIVIGLIGSEKILDHDFVCPCKEMFRVYLFWLYLVIPVITTFTITFYLTHRTKEKITEERRKQERTIEEQQRIGQCCAAWAKKLGVSLFVSLIWVVLFFADGRYLACLKSEIDREKVGQNCPSEENISNSSRIAGFFLLLALTLVALSLKCLHPCCHGGCANYLQCSCLRFSKMCRKECFKECCEDCCDERCEEFYKDATMDEAHMDEAL